MSGSVRKSYVRTYLRSNFRTYSHTCTDVSSYFVFLFGKRLFIIPWRDRRTQPRETACLLEPFICSTDFWVGTQQSRTYIRTFQFQYVFPRTFRRTFIFCFPIGETSVRRSLEGSHSGELNPGEQAFLLEPFICSTDVREFTPSTDTMSL